MPCLITITHRTVEHNDPEAAGFTDGYWWTLTTDDELPNAESAAATAEAAEEFARRCAQGRGYLEEDDITILTEGKLLKRKADEARVEALIAEHGPE